MMIELLFKFESTRFRHTSAPMLDERVMFLKHLHHQGTSLRRLKSISAILLHIIRILDLQSARMVSPNEVIDAAQRWASDRHIVKGNRPKSTDSFDYIARRWLSYLELLSPVFNIKRFDDPLLDDFYDYLTVHRTFSHYTVRGYMGKLAPFLRWLSERELKLTDVSFQHIDAYLEFCKSSGLQPRTRASICSVLREFFRFAFQRGLIKRMIASGIVSPRILRCNKAPRGPDWTDVRRLLDHKFGSNPIELRAKAITTLGAIYALRSCEVTGLLLSDIDWITERLTIRRAKNRRIQQFPLQSEAAKAILSYLQYGRPKCECRNLFVTLRPPYRAMQPSITWHVVSHRMKLLGIRSPNYGVHSLRHSCATHLLRSGTSLQEIAEFLGHTDMASVNIYAQYDLKSLTEIASFRLLEIM